LEKSLKNSEIHIRCTEEEKYLFLTLLSNIFTSPHDYIFNYVSKDILRVDDMIQNDKLFGVPILDISKSVYLENALYLRDKQIKLLMRSAFQPINSRVVLSKVAKATNDTELMKKLYSEFETINELLEQKDKFIKLMKRNTEEIEYIIPKKFAQPIIEKKEKKEVIKK